MRSWKRTEIISILLASLVLVLTTWNAVRDASQARLDRNVDAQLRAVLGGVSSLLNSLVNAETSQRGYLLTHHLKYLELYQKASVEIPFTISRLKKLLPPGRDRDLLFDLTSKKMAELKETIDLSKRVSFQAAVDKVSTDIGKTEMDSIRVVVGRLSDLEYMKSAQRASAAEERTGRAGLVAFAGSAALLTLLTLAAVTINRNTVRRERLIEQLRRDEAILRELRRKSQDAEARTSDILESIADGFVSLDGHSHITYVNNAAERILARRKGELLGRNFWEEFPEEATPEVKARYTQVIASQQPLTFELFSQKRNSWWDESVYPSKENGLTIYFRDITERKRMEDRSRHTQKLESLGVLAGGIAHDFNNLLTAILGGVSLVQADLPPDSEAAQNLRIVTNASERAAQLTRQMLAYSGRGRFVVEPMDLSKQVEEITELLKASLKREVELILNLEAGGVWIEADAGQMHQLIMNLVLNGAEAIEIGQGTVVVSTRLQELDVEYVRDNMAGDDVVPGPYLLLEVHDTGKGMDTQTLGRIFDPFFTTKFTGRGLGLAAVLGIVRGHRGSIRVYSNPGLGTTFKVFFPIVHARRDDSPKPAATPVSLRGHETVLVVDDEDTVQRLASAALSRYGYKVLQARNGREALDIFERDPEAIAVVLLDMTMPVMSGEETLKHLKAVRPDIPIIASSGYNEIEALRRFGTGVCGFLQKPYRAAQLAEKIRAALSVYDSE